VSLYDHWADLKRERPAFDTTIIDWAGRLDPAWPQSDPTWYSGARKQDLGMPRSLLLMHFINHQTHHRGQVHRLLTQAGEKCQHTDLTAMDS
jgi:uncharacterized damage-inducible protein DinB